MDSDILMDQRCIKFPWIASSVYLPFAICHNAITWVGALEHRAWNICMYLYLWKLLVNENPNGFDIFVLKLPSNHQYFIIMNQYQSKIKYNVSMRTTLQIIFWHLVWLWYQQHRLFEEEQRNSDWALSLFSSILIFEWVQNAEKKNKIVFHSYWMFSMSPCHCFDGETFSRSMYHGNIAVILYHFLCICRHVDAKAYISEWNSMICAESNDVITFITSPYK